MLQYINFQNFTFQTNFAFYSIKIRRLMAEICLIAISQLAKGSLRIKKCHKKSTRGGGAGKKHQKVQNSKFGLFDRRGGHIFIFFPNSNAHFRYFSWKKNKLVLKWFLGNFKCFKLMFHIWGGVPKIQSFPNFKFFPN